ncbi:hypothetical protein D3C72_1773090 [compost metagenome]
METILENSDFFVRCDKGNVFITLFEQMLCGKVACFKIVKFDHRSRNIFMGTVKNDQAFALIDHFLKMLGFLRLQRQRSNDAVYLSFK